jgi:hypothetical protein
MYDGYVKYDNIPDLWIGDSLTFSEGNFKNTFVISNFVTKEGELMAEGYQKQKLLESDVIAINFESRLVPLEYADFRTKDTYQTLKIFWRVLYLIAVQCQYHMLFRVVFFLM